MEALNCEKAANANNVRSQPEGWARGKGLEGGGGDETGNNEEVSGLALPCIAHSPTVRILDLMSFDII